jgi:hypothetical protein
MPANESTNSTYVIVVAAMARHHNFTDRRALTRSITDIGALLPRD